MRGKSWSIPAGMVFQTYHCAKCGARLKKEKTHRIVTALDHDYYQYHNVGTYPLCDYDVYSYRFQCPACGARISYDEQCIIKQIQKKQRAIVLSPSVIKGNYQACKTSNHRRVLIYNILISVILLLAVFIPFYFLQTNQTTKDLIGVSLLFLIFVISIVVATIRRYKGNYKLKFKHTYSYEKESQLERLHAYCSHNRNTVMLSSKCYCFFCMHRMVPGEITDYTDNGQTALCPQCGMDCVIPDGIEEEVNEGIAAEMHLYWF